MEEEDGRDSGGKMTLVERLRDCCPPGKCERPEEMRDDICLQAEAADRIEQLEAEIEMLKAELMAWRAAGQPMA